MSHESNNAEVEKKLNLPEMSPDNLQSENPVIEDVSFLTLLDKHQDIATKLATNGITSATPVQYQTVPEALLGQDLIVQAQTGSGKTLAYVIPLIAKLRALPHQTGTYGLIVAPTRELAVQVCSVIESLADDIKPVCVIGGTSQQNQVDKLSEDKRIVVGTPGRLLDLIQQREIVLRRCGYFVLDEADEMLSMGFLEDVRSILSRLPDKRQGLFVSATITPRVQMLAQSFLRKPKTIVVRSKTESAPDITHLFCEVGTGVTDKALALCDLIETQRPTTTIIFCNTKSDTELVEVLLRRRGYDARRINSDLSQQQRDKIMNSVRAGELKILIATDIAARGLDIDHIDLVIHYSLHDQHETYVHRSGRTGRAGRIGTAISLIGAQDFTSFHALKKAVSIEFKKLDLPTDEDVAGAKLAHFYELLRETPSKVGSREAILAKKMISDLSGITQPNEEFVDSVAKLYSFSMQSLAKPEAAALDTVLDQNQGPGSLGAAKRGSSGGGGRDRYSDRRR